LILAAEGAAKALQGRANRLIGRSFLAPSEGGLSAEETRELRLLQKRYGIYLDEDARELVAQAYARASSFSQARYFMGREAGRLGRPQQDAVAAQPDSAVQVAFPNGSAQKIFEGMQASKTDWTNREIIQLMTSFGFEYTPGKKHDKFQYQDIYLTVPRRNPTVKPAYVGQVLQTIGRREARLRPPQPVSIGNLSVRP
jgi:hypothetical protein